MSDSTKHWWRVSFCQPGDWEPHIDLFLAREIVKPILDDEKKHLRCWRFHRGRGELAFDFYSAEKVKDRIMDRLEDSLTSHEQYQQIEQQVTPRLNRKPYADNWQGIADGAWGEEIRQAWPYFAQGLAQMWLTLIDQVANVVLQQGTSAPPGSVAFYQDVGQQIEGHWFRHGAHAFLHHVHALLGYSAFLAEVHHQFLVTSIT